MTIAIGIIDRTGSSCALFFGKAPEVIVATDSTTGLQQVIRIDPRTRRGRVQMFDRDSMIRLSEQNMALLQSVCDRGGCSPMLGSSAEVRMRARLKTNSSRQVGPVRKRRIGACPQG